MKPGGHGGGKGHTGKHAGTHKHHPHHAKHHPKRKSAHHPGHGGIVNQIVTAKKTGHPHHPRGLAIGELLPVCTFEALAMSLRLAGGTVGEDDLLELWWRAGEREVSIAATLDAAAQFGLAGCRPYQWPAVIRSNTTPAMAVRMIAIDQKMATASWRMPLILGVDLPGPHAVVATADGWWSWGSLWSPWTTAVSEAWAVSWR